MHLSTLRLVNSPTANCFYFMERLNYICTLNLNLTLTLSTIDSILHSSVSIQPGYSPITARVSLIWLRLALWWLLVTPDRRRRAVLNESTDGFVLTELEREKTGKKTCRHQHVTAWWWMCPDHSAEYTLMCVRVLWSPRGQVLVLEDNFEVLGLGLESRALALQVKSLALASWLKSLEKLEDTLFTNHCMFCTNDFKGNNLEFCLSPITE